MKPVVANPSASFGQLLDGLKVLKEEKQIWYQINQIIAKLQRKKRKLDGKTMEHFVSMTGGMDPTQFIQQLEQELPKQARNRILAHRDLFELLGETRANDGCSVIIYDMPDKLVSHTRGYGTGSRPEDYLDAFADYVKTHINEIAALNIVCNRPKELTWASLKDLRLTLDREGFATQQLNIAISELANEGIAADIISLIRRYAIGSTMISHEARIRWAVDKLKKAHKFTAIEQKWIGRMEKYIMEESVLNVGVFDEDTRFRSEGVFKKID